MRVAFNARALYFGQPERVLRSVRAGGRHLSGELRTEVQGTDLIVSVDTDGDGLADFAVLVKNISVLSFADFLL